MRKVSAFGFTIERCPAADMVFPRRRAVLFAHGCFWHGHDCHLFKWPSTRMEFWRAKIARNREVDARAAQALAAAGWRYGVVWECATKGRTRTPAESVIKTCADWSKSESPYFEIGRARISIVRRGLLSDYFEGVAVKRLSVVERSPSRSNQREFYSCELLRRLLGDAYRQGIQTRFVWLAEEQEGVTDDGTLTWYDARRRHPTRTEHRLHDPANDVSEMMKAGETFFFATRPDSSAMVIMMPAESTIQNQLLWLFGLEPQPKPEFDARDIAGR